jgi:hypothetical protein
VRRIGVLVGIILTGALWAATAVAAPADVTHLSPASTSVDHAPFCDVSLVAPEVNPGPGGTAVTFTLVPPGCD